MPHELVKCLGREVIIAPARYRRPKQKRKKMKKSECPFCPGNEHMTTKEIDRIGTKARWICRSFSNKFPAVSPKFKKAYGYHEVIVDTPRHSAKLHEIDLELYLSFVLKRMRELASRKNIRYVMMFKNNGIPAGASLLHPHTQLAALSEVPPVVLKENDAFQKKCPLCHPKFVLHKNNTALCAVSEAPIFNYELHVMLRNHKSGLPGTKEEIQGLATALKLGLSKLDKVLGDPNYRIYMHYFPRGCGHFHISICPKTNNWSGFEIGSGIIIVSVEPERAYRELRTA